MAQPSPELRRSRYSAPCSDLDPRDLDGFLQADPGRVAAIEDDRRLFRLDILQDVGHLLAGDCRRGDRVRAGRVDVDGEQVFTAPPNRDSTTVAREVEKNDRVLVDAAS